MYIVVCRSQRACAWARAMYFGFNHAVSLGTSNTDLHNTLLISPLLSSHYSTISHCARPILFMHTRTASLTCDMFLPAHVSHAFPISLTVVI